MCGELIDPFCVQPIFVEGLAAIRKIGTTNIEYTMYSVIDGVRVVSARIVWPLEAVMLAHKQIRGFFETGALLTSEATELRFGAH